MNMTHRITSPAVTLRLRGPALLAIALLLLPCTWGLAQDEDDAEPGPGPARPAAQPAAPAKSAPKLDLRFEPPAIRSVLEGNPTTPKELIRAVETLVDLRRPELAKPFLKQLLDAKPDAKTLIALAGEFGSASFLKFAHNPDLAPEGAQLADAVLSAAEAARTEPAMLVKLVTQLSAADRNTREDAIVGLFKAQQAAVVPLVRALMDPARAREQQAVRSMLVRLGGYAVPPLVAMLESREPTAKLRAAEVLGRLRAKEAIPGLLVPAVSSTSSPELKAAAGAALNEILGRIPSDTEAIELLRHDARAALQKVKFERADMALSVERWRWDDKLIQSVLVQMPPADAAALDAARLAGDAYMLQADAETGRLFILAQLTAAKLLGGLDHPLAKGEGTVFAQIAAFGPDAVEAALATALAEGQFTAATGAVEILADIGREDMLYRSGPALSPLADAARSNDRRLRFAATDTILQLKPTRPFAGAAAIPQNLAFFAGTSGFRRAIVGHARREPGQQVVSLLSALDYEADGVTSAREFFNLTSQSPDYELGFIHVSLDQSGADELLAHLRHDPRTADLPIGLIAPTERWNDAERVAAALPAVTAVPPMRTESALKFQIARMRERAGRDLVSFAERQNQALAALQWLGRLTDNKEQPFNLQTVEPAVARALYVPDLTRPAALVLANLPSAAAQSALVDMASRTVLPIAVRQAAATAFGAACASTGSC